MREIAFISSLDPSDKNRLRVHLQTDGGILKDVTYQYEAFIDEQWIAIVRYDCAHGFFHRDVLFPNGDKEKQSIEMDSLKSASKYAEQDLKDRWEWYRERYMKKNKK
ncbi:MAG: hypothetical protein LBT49_03810 [Prevotellaceae bacterium]|jgi:hypothetical protein|nr:hypothetical protein [Prevotellaceae bacterium]